MAQVVRTTNDVIVNALYLTGELGVGETPDAFMLTTGLELINEILDQLSSDSIYVPYLTTLSFDFVPGQATYSISDMVAADVTADRIVDLSFANYQLPSSDATALVYPLIIISKAEYYDVVRQTNLQARPGYIFLNKQAAASYVTTYPIPDQPYPCTLGVKCMINKLGAQDDLSSLPPNYYGFLKFAVARRFMAYYPSANWPPQNEEQYSQYFQILKNTNETDLTVRPSAILSAKDPFYWQYILSY